MKKFLLLLLMSVLINIAGKAQLSPATTMQAPAGIADSANTRYVKVKVATSGVLTIQANCIKVANTGTTVAGYALLQESLNDTVYVNTSTLKNSSTIGVAPSWGIDTFTFANQTTVQGKIWHVTNGNEGEHPAVFYRIVFVPTTTKLQVWGDYWLYKD